MDKYKITNCFLFVLFLSCQQGPKIISEPINTKAPSTSSGIFETKDEEQVSNNISAQNELHMVVALETLETDRYVYIRVKEENKEYWVATSNREIIIGETYYFSNALRKTKFESQEYGRIFDELYLVGNIVPASHSKNSSPPSSTKVDVETHTTSSPVQSKVASKATNLEVTIMELVENPTLYDDQIIQLKGKCTKVNNNIMGRNWIHLQDGTKDDYDLVITSKSKVAEGASISVRGKVGLDVDFGAGYAYAIIIENAEIF